MTPHRRTVKLNLFDISAQVPAIGLEREREPPGDADEVLGLEAGAWWTCSRPFLNSGLAPMLARWICDSAIAT